MARPKKDPLLQALIDKLPPESDWPVDKQLAWLNLMAMAFGTIYGGDASQQLGIKQEPNPMQVPPKSVSLTPAKKPTKPNSAEYAFIIDEGGYVRRGGNGEQLSPKDVAGKTVYDMRGLSGNPGSIIWADGSTGLNGADINISSV